MTYHFTEQENALIYRGASYPFVKPEDFDTWLKTKQDAFIQGYLHAYVGALQEQVNATPWSQQEILL